MDRRKIRPNPTPRQVIISHDTYEKLRRAARSLPMYVRVYLILAEAAGRRRSAVRLLEWRDVLFESGEIHWRPENDKMGHDDTIVASRRVLRYLRAWKRHCPSEQYVFPAPRDPLSVASKSTVGKWFKQLYNAAGLERPKGAGWHSFRRKWATERQDYSLPILKAAGGWASTQALLRYIREDREAVSRAVLEPTRRVS